MGLLDTKQEQQQPTRGLLALSEPQKAGVFDYVLATLGGGVAGAATLGLQQRQQQRAYKGQQAGLAALGQSADLAGLTPQERFALRLNPQAALDMLADRSKVRDVAGGNSIYANGQFKMADKLVEDGGVYGTQTANGYTQTGQRAINHQELETERHNTQGETLEGDRNRETGRHNLAGEGIDLGQLAVSRGQLGVAQGQLGLAGQRLAFDKTGGVAGVNGGANGKPTDAQAQAGFNASRLANAGRTLGAIEKSGFNPGVGMLGGGLNVAAGGNTARQYEQSENEWSDALLRLTSGAQASKEEIAQTRATYFPKLGDSPQVRAQKAAARAAVERQAVRRAGPAGQQPAAAPADPLGIR